MFWELRKAISAAFRHFNLTDFGVYITNHSTDKIYRVFQNQL